MRSSLLIHAARAAAWATALTWISFAFADGPPAAHDGPVYLQRSSASCGWAKPAGQGSRGPLVREIQRQAFLLAARDQLGLATRDAWLGDAMPTAGENEPFEIDRGDGPKTPLEVRRGFFPATRVIDRWELKPAAGGDYSRAVSEWLAAAERFSRTNYVGALEKCGFHGKANPRRDAAGVPDEIEQGLSEMVFTSQLIALRRLHALVRSDGESPARLGALVRGYANLGTLTEFHWHPAHKVFKARAMLYAQRMVANATASLSSSAAGTPASPPSAFALWHRAYAYAAAGLHNLALDDLKNAEKRAKSGGQRPAWVDLIDAYCRFDADQLTAAKTTPECRQLAALLRYLSIEQSGDENAAVAAGIEVVKEMPECYRIHDGICQHGGVGTGQTATVEWLAIAGKSIYPVLAAMPDLPAGAAAIAQEFEPADSEGAAGKEYETRAKLVRALADEPAADLGEPSCACLGRLIAELSFVQVWRAARFQIEWLDVSTEEFLKESAPLAANHCYAGYIETFAYDRGAKEAAWKKFRITQPDALGINEYPMVFAYYRVRHPQQREVMDHLLATGLDATAGDLSALLPMLTDDDQHLAPTIRALLAASPYSPLARAAAIERCGDEFHGHFADWEKGAANDPQISKAFARHYTEESRWDDVVRCAKTAIAASPDLPTYILLADAYWYAGKTDLWATTLEEYLNQPDYGLAHGQTCERLARHFMARKQWKRAMVYAEGAAETGAEWGMQVIAECYEATQRWKRAEEIRREEAERYTAAGPLSWYCFCRRTGHGDVDAARASCRPGTETDDSGRISPLTAAGFYLLEKKPKKALPPLAGKFDRTGDPIAGLWLAIVHDELKDAKARDAVLARLKQPKSKPNDAARLADPSPGAQSTDTQLSPTIRQLAKLLAADLAAGGKGRIDLAAADRIVDAEKAKLRKKPLQNDDSPSFYDYFLGKYLSLHGKPDEAIAYWKKCMAETENFGYLPRTLAGAELCERGVLPESYRSLWENNDAPAEKNP